jgi:hypothetical protein
MVYFVDRILKGAKSADLPMEQALVVNLKTAKLFEKTGFQRGHRRPGRSRYRPIHVPSLAACWKARGRALGSL